MDRIRPRSTDGKGFAVDGSFKAGRWKWPKPGWGPRARCRTRSDIGPRPKQMLHRPAVHGRLNEVHSAPQAGERRHSVATRSCRGYCQTLIRGNGTCDMLISTLEESVFGLQIRPTR